MEDSPFPSRPAPTPALAPAGVRPGPGRGGWAVLAVLAVALALPEAVLQGAELGLWGSARWRPLAYQNAAFWVGLLGDWRPNYPAQPWLMFASYGVLHAGALHLAVNLATLASLGVPVLAQAGAARFLAVFALGQIGGGLGFALLSRSVQPMVGASGALFGLAGAWVVWFAADAARRGGPWAGLRAFAVPSAVLAGLNLAMYRLADGQLAWEAHLGGFLAGALAGGILRRGR
jgi:rhomboid protease GluP